MKNLLFVGLGRMGFPMAAHLAKNKELSVSVYNRSRSKAQQWLNENEGRELLPEDHFDVIILCVGNDEDVRSTLVGALNLLDKVKPGGVIVDHTTTSSSLAQDMYAIAQAKGIGYLDAPVSGSEEGAVKGQLSCMIGGDANHFTYVTPVLNIYCKSMTHIGKSGSGQIAKMSNQFCIAGTLAGLSEAIQLLKKAEVDTDHVFQAIKGGAAQSWQMDNRFETMIKREFDFGFAIKHMIKDLKYALQLAGQQDWEPTISKQILQWYERLSQENHDTSCLVEHYEN